MFKQAVFLPALLSLVGGFYLPGVVPRDYDEGEAVVMKVNKLDSVTMQLPRDFYSLAFCQPEAIQQNAENLGEILSGDKIETSPYTLRMKVMQHCELLCRKELTKPEMALFTKRVHENYHSNLIVDNIPAARSFMQSMYDRKGNKIGDSEKVYVKGYPLGFVAKKDSNAKAKEGAAYLNNHLRFDILYHEEPESYEGSRIVGFEISSFSVKHAYSGTFSGNTVLDTCNALNPVSQESTPQPLETEDNEVIFTYDVRWTKSDIKWASRWDMYLKPTTGASVHWFSIGNSFMIMIGMSVAVASVLVHILRKDLAKYNELATELADEDPELEKGWKLVHGDVFRPPAHSTWLAVAVGTGCQITGCVFVTLLFACMGFLSPANRGSLGTALLLVFVLMGFVAGYTGTKLYCRLGLQSWKGLAVKIVLAFPGMVFSLFFVINLFVWAQGSTGAVPFGTLVALMLLWLGISAPLVYLGAYTAARTQPEPFAKRVNNIARLIPVSDDWSASPFMVLLYGSMPFAAISGESFFLFTSAWNHQFYYIFGILALLFLMLIIVSAEISIVATFMHVGRENYHWWWPSFFASGSMAIYMFLYVIYFFVTLESASVISGVVFLGYAALICVSCCILTGTVGFLASLFFMQKIYGSLKID